MEKSNICGKAEEDEVEAEVEDRYTVTVYDQYTDGSADASAVVSYVKPGDMYRVDSTVIEGYNSSAVFVAGAIPEGPALIVLIVVAAAFVWKHHDMKKQEKDLGDQMSELREGRAVPM